MHKKQLAWILLPTAIVLMVVVTLVLSNYQEEVGIAKPGKSGVVAVAALAEAVQTASGTGAAGYDLFSQTLTVAAAKVYNMTTTNAAETRLRTAAVNTLDCLSAGREAWQAELEQDWEPTVDGSADYWLTLHSGLQPQQLTSGLSVGQVCQWANSSAEYWLQKALALVE